MSQPRVGDRVGRYRIDAVLGEGGMGVVYAATDPHVRRRVALKVMSSAVADDPGFRRRFAREADVLARLDSPHVIAILDHGVHPGKHPAGGAPYLVTQLVGGGELGQLLRTRGALPPRLAATVCAQVAEALLDAHAAGVVHRDVKPSNVLLHDADAAVRGGELHAYLCDFGIAQTEADAASELTRPGGVVGTWQYLAPERLRGAPATPASDTYAVGCLLWACLVGRAPYAGSDAEVAAAHLGAPVPRLANAGGFETQANDLLARTMAKDPAARPGDAELRRRLRALSATAAPAGVESGVDGGAPATPQRRQRGRAVPALAALALAVLVLVGAGAWLATRDDAPVTAAGPTESPSGAEDQPTEDQAGTVGPVTGDLDGDGRGDLVLRYRDEQDRAVLATYASDGSGLQDPTTQEDPGPGTVLVRGDFDGDDVDALVRLGGVRDGDAVEVVDLGTGERRSVLDAGFLLRPTVGDFDGDGSDDLVFVEPAEQGIGVSVRVAVTNEAGDGFVSAGEWITGTWDPTTSEVQAGDVDGDGRDDLVLVRRGADAPTANGDSTVQLLRSDGSSFTAVADADVVADEGEGLVAVGDLDGDDAAELVVVPRTYAGPIRTLTWEGEGFSPPVTAADAPGLENRLYLESVGLSDLDGDGDDDLLVVRRTGDEETYGVVGHRSDGVGLAEPELLAEFAGDRIDPVASVVGPAVEDPLF